MFDGHTGSMAGYFWHSLDAGNTWNLEEAKVRPVRRHVCVCCVPSCNQLIPSSLIAVLSTCTPLT